MIELTGKSGELSPSKGHGDIVLMQQEDGSVQLRDNLSRLWCACGRPAVHYASDVELPQYQFQCIKCSWEVSHDPT